MLRKYHSANSVYPVFRIYLTLIVLRPLIDTTWSFKHAWGLSPLQLVGALLAPFFVYALAQRAQGGQSTQRVETLSAQVELLLLASLIAVGSASALLLRSPGSLTYIAEHILRTAILALAPLFGALYLKEEALRTLLAQCLLASVIFPLGMLYYEIIAGPIGVSERSFTLRYTGLYAQVSVYGIHFTMALLAAVYLAIKRRELQYLILLTALLLLLAFAAPYILHLSTYIVLIGLSLAAGVALLVTKRHWAGVLLLIAAAVVFVTSHQLSGVGSFAPSYMPDVEVLQGVKPAGAFANSRGYIWQNHYREFVSLPLHAKLLGHGWSDKPWYSALGFGAHNDFIRIVFAGGLIGLLLYLLFLARLLRRIPKLPLPERVLLIGGIIIWLGYSVALTPSYIVPLMTVLLPMFGALTVERVEVSAEPV